MVWISANAMMAAAPRAMLASMDFGMIQGLFVLVFSVVAIFGGYFAMQAEKKRKAALRAWADEQGWKLDKSKRSSTAYPFPIFNAGHSRFSQYHGVQAFPEIVEGIEEPSLFDVFQYHYAITSNNGKTSSTTHYYFCCLAVFVGIDLGEVNIRDEHFGDKIAARFGSNDIDFEDPDFSKQFHVTAPNRKDAFDLIHHALMRYMVQSAGSGLTIYTRGKMLFVHMTGRADVARYERLVRFAGGFLQQVPRTLVNAERAKQGLPALVEAGAAATRARHARTGEALPAEPVAPQGTPGESESVPSRNPDPDGPARLL